MYKGKIQLRDLSKELQALFANAAANGGGIAYLKGTTTITEDTNRVEIPVAYDPKTDMMMIMHNSTYMEIRRDYTINADGNAIEKIGDDKWLASEDEPGVFNFVLFKAVPASDIVVDGGILIPGSVKPDALSEEFITWLKNKLDLKDSKIILDGQVGSLNSNVHEVLLDHENRIKQNFQYANDGKTNIAGVIGSPAASSNTFSQLKTYIQNDKNTLATNLVNKGVSANSNETLQTLAQKVGNIPSRKEVIEKGLNGGITATNGRSYSPHATGNDVISHVDNIGGDPLFKQLLANYNENDEHQWSFKSYDFNISAVYNKVVSNLANFKYSKSTDTIKFNSSTPVNIKAHYNSKDHTTTINYPVICIISKDSKMHVYKESDLSSYGIATDYNDIPGQDEGKSLNRIFNNQYITQYIFLYYPKLKSYFKLETSIAHNKQWMPSIIGNFDEKKIILYANDDNYIQFKIWDLDITIS